MANDTADCEDDTSDPEYGSYCDSGHSATRLHRSSTPPLPTLSEQPALYPASCLALSKPLLDHLSSLCKSMQVSSGPILSIGSGHGLLEALLLAEPYSLNIIGIEVHPSPNQYLPVSHHRTVIGTRFLDPLATESVVWLFVYPRRVGLVDEYMAAHGDGNLKRIVWIGPEADWNDYKSSFRDKTWSVQVIIAGKVGGRAWELVAVATKHQSM